MLSPQALAGPTRQSTSKQWGTTRRARQSHVQQIIAAAFNQLDLILERLVLVAVPVVVLRLVYTFNKYASDRLHWTVSALGQ